MTTKTAGSAVSPYPSSGELERFRAELTGYCYRMLGSGFEAEDAVQETMVRAWRASHTFEGRSSLRTWIYRVATNVCLDMGREVQRRARPMELGPSSPPEESYLGQPLPEPTWIVPIADGSVRPETEDPAEITEHRETIRLAFVAALQHLSARQRAVLVLCEVLRWRAYEVAELLETSVAAVNSTLQRARAALGTPPGGSTAHPPDLTDPDAELLGRYLDAFERYDVDALVALLHDDAVQSMPPFEMWIEGARNIAHFMLEPAPSACRGSRLVRIAVNGHFGVNGCPAFAQFKPDPEGGFLPWSVQVLEISQGKIASLSYFLSMLAPERLFPFFGLPLHVDAEYFERLA